MPRARARSTSTAATPWRAHALDTRQLAGADLVLVDPRWPEGAESALQWAFDQGVPSMLDADVAPRAVIDHMLNLVRWAVFSDHCLAAWAPGVPFDLALARALSSGPAAGRGPRRCIRLGLCGSRLQVRAGWGIGGAPTRAQLATWRARRP